MDREFTDRLDAELASVKARIEAQKRLLESTGDLQNETAAADLRALLDRLQSLEESHGG